MSKGLCWECKKHISESGNPYILSIQKLLHCHHEPKEKPKCWCDHGFRDINYGYGWHMTPKFCPECGTKL